MGAREAETAAELHAAAIRLLRSLRREDVALGLGTARASLLSVIVFAGRPLGIGELAAIEQVRPPTMTRLVDRLEAAGLVARARDPDDLRNVLVSPTPKGVRLMQAGRERRVRRLAAAMERLSGPELETLAKAARLVRALEL